MKRGTFAGMACALALVSAACGGAAGPDDAAVASCKQFRQDLADAKAGTITPAVWLTMFDAAVKRAGESSELKMRAAYMTIESAFDRQDRRPTAADVGNLVNIFDSACSDLGQ